MKLNATETVIVKEAMNEWRKFVKPSKGILQNNPADYMSANDTYHTFAIDCINNVIFYNFNNIELYDGELENIKAEVTRRVDKAIAKDKKVLHGLYDELGIKY
jgi:hypothetical protein